MLDSSGIDGAGFAIERFEPAGGLHQPLVKHFDACPRCIAVDTGDRTGAAGDDLADAPGGFSVFIK